MKERDRLFVEASERFRENLLHNASIGCAIETERRPSALDVWRQHAKITHVIEARYPVCKKVRRYATQWRAVAWAPHFYDVVSVIDHYEVIPQYLIRDYRLREGLEIFVRSEARVDRDKVVVPVRTPAVFDVLTSMRPDQARTLITQVFEFPPVICTQQVSPFVYERLQEVWTAIVQSAVWQMERLVAQRFEVKS